MPGYLSNERVRVVFRLSGPLDMAIIPPWMDVIQERLSATRDWKQDRTVYTYDRCVEAHDLLRRMDHKGKRLTHVCVREDTKEGDVHHHVRFDFWNDPQFSTLDAQASEEARMLIEHLLGKCIWRSASIFRVDARTMYQTNVSFGPLVSTHYPVPTTPYDHFGIRQVAAF